MEESPDAQAQLHFGSPRRTRHQPRTRATELSAKQSKRVSISFSPSSGEKAGMRGFASHYGRSSSIFRTAIAKSTVTPAFQTPRLFSLPFSPVPHFGESTQLCPPAIKPPEKGGRKRKMKTGRHERQFRGTLGRARNHHPQHSLLNERHFSRAPRVNYSFKSAPRQPSGVGLSALDFGPWTLEPGPSLVVPNRIQSCPIVPKNFKNIAPPLRCSVPPRRDSTFFQIARPQPRRAKAERTRTALRVPASAFRVPGSAFRVPGSAFRVGLTWTNSG